MVREGDTHWVVLHADTEKGTYHVITPLDAYRPCLLHTPLLANIPVLLGGGNALIRASRDWRLKDWTATRDLHIEDRAPKIRDMIKMYGHIIERFGQVYWPATSSHSLDAAKADAIDRLKLGWDAQVYKHPHLPDVFTVYQVYTAPWNLPNWASPPYVVLTN